MTLTKEAIEKIEQSASLENVQNRVKYLESSGELRSTLVATVGPHGDVILKDVENSKVFRDSYRFSFQTHSITSFAEYAKEFEKEGAKCFINQDEMKAKTIFDLGTKTEPGHQEHEAIIALKKTSAFKALLSVAGAALSQRAASEFIEDWADFITVLDQSGDKMKTRFAAKQLRELKIEQSRQLDSIVGDFGESMSAMEAIEAKSYGATPATIIFKCEPYSGLSLREFEVRISIITGGNKPEISLRIVKLEKQEEDMAVEFQEIIVKKLAGTVSGTKIKTLIGSES